jgi:very-short-patch-repair endonuclease
MPKGILQGSTEAHAQARELRKSTTVAENALWDLLRHRHLGGLKFRRQFPIGRFITDFCCYSLRLIVELDGAVHELPAQAAHDKNRDAYLRWRGYTVLRISNHRLVDDPEGVLEEIQAAARQRGWVP